MVSFRGFPVTINERINEWLQDQPVGFEIIQVISNRDSYNDDEIVINLFYRIPNIDTWETKSWNQ